MGTVLPFPGATSPAALAGPSTAPEAPLRTGFTRGELNRIVDLYGRMVAAGLWKDYAIEFGRDHAAFWHNARRAVVRPLPPTLQARLPVLDRPTAGTPIAA